MSALRKLIKTRLVLAWTALLALGVATGGCEGCLFAKKKDAQQVRQPVSRPQRPRPPAAAAAPRKVPAPKAKDPKGMNRRELDELLSIE